MLSPNFARKLIIVDRGEYTVRLYSMAEVHSSSPNTFDHEGLFLFLSSPQPMWYVPLELTHCSKFLEPTSASWRLAWIRFVFLRCIECLGKVGNDIWLGIWQHDINRKEGGNSFNHLCIWYQILQYQTSRHPEIFVFLHCEGKNSSL